MVVVCSGEGKEVVVVLAIQVVVVVVGVDAPAARSPEWLAVLSPH